jgi:GMP synthase (glutamine-hydrolysing)
MIAIIDNGSRYIRELLNFLERREYDFRLYPPYPEILESLEADIILLTGASYLRKYRYFLGEKRLILNGRVPILGICFGHQVIGAAFGGKILKMEKKQEGKEEIWIKKDEDILKGLKNPFFAFENHYFEINLPDGFELLASSKGCEIEVMKHVNRDIYGVQFHLEIEKYDASRILHNFLKMYDE